MKKWLISVVVLLLLGVLAFEYRMARARPYYLTQFHVRILAVHPGPNGSAHVDVLLTNGTSVPLNIIDDSAGNPAFILVPAEGQWSTVSTMVNMLKLNLAPHAALTNTVLLTNAPPRFRLMCDLRNLEVERRVWTVYRVLPAFMAKRVIEWRRREWELPFQFSDWAELPAATNADSSQR